MRHRTEYTCLTAQLVAAFVCGATSVASVEWQRTKCVSVSHFASRILSIIILKGVSYWYSCFEKKSTLQQLRNVLQITVIHDLTSFQHTSFLTERLFSPRPTILSQEHKFVNTMLQIFSSFWTSMIKSSHSKFWFKFGSIAPLNKLRKLRIWACCA
jgi:hypothetical protein